MQELRGLLVQLDGLGLEPPDSQASELATGSDSSDDDSPASAAAELRVSLDGGLQHCLHWLYGLELPGLDKLDGWGGSFQVGWVD